ncbi:hypothetical protein BJ741DRAFT_620143 [Chytriomyces cf. hyalinus JEL632]|nr:hypothetical protein BJ741DRAFT_620143 [Chytriomyces cf. hyalinus JEL632]
MSYVDREQAQEMRMLSFMWGGVNFSSIVFLLVFTICVDLPRRGVPVSFETIFTTSHSLLLGVHVAATSYQIFKGFFLDSGNHIFRVAAAFSFGVSGALYLFFSWARSSDILKNQYNARMYRIFLTLLWLTPFTCTLPAVAKLSTFSLPIAESEKYYNMGHFVSGSVVTVMDAYFAWAFYSYLVKFARPTISQGVPHFNDNGARLQIIAQYGLISSCFCFLALTGFVALMVSFFLDPSLASPSVWRVYRVCYITADFGATASVVTPIVMKVRLHQVGMAGIRIREEGNKTFSTPNADSEGVLTMQKTVMSLKRANTNPSLVVTE